MIKISSKNIFSKVGKPTKIKKLVYLASFITLGLLLSFNLHALIELNYLRWSFNKNIIIQFYGGCALPPIVQIAIILLGFGGGLYLGLFWWRKIYIERCLDKTFKKI
jgi:hypothetical protein